MSPEVAIVGAGGGVGSSVAFNLLLRDEPYDVAMVDGRSGMAQSHEMDLQQVVVAAGGAGSVRIVGLGEITRADVVVVSAAVPLTVNDSRMAYLRQNAAVVREVTGVLRAQTDWPGVLVLVTNPLDPLLTWLHRLGGLDRRRLLGYSANDSLRMRTAVADGLGVAPESVDAWVLGEHGDHCVPLWERVRVGGAPATLDAGRRRVAEEFVRGWYARHVALDSARSSTWTTGLGVARMVHAVLHGDGEAWPASVVLDGEYGIEDVALTVPVDLGPDGVERIHEWPLEPHEREALGTAAEAVRDAAARLDAG
jgi:malate dehydrogenase